MLDNTVTFDSGGESPLTRTLELDTRNDNRSTYFDVDSHSSLSRDMVQFYRTRAKPNAVTNGSDKHTVKITRDVDVTNAEGSGTVNLPAIVECKFSFPLGMSDAEKTIMRTRLMNLIAVPPFSDDFILDGQI